MSKSIPLYIPAFINDQEYSPARVLPRLFFYNGMLDCEPWYFEHRITTNNVISQQIDKFPYFDHYNVVTGSFPTTGSLSLLFNNESPVYGATPTASLYTEYFEKYINLLYNPYTRLLNAKAIIPLADYFDMELNDVVNFRGNYWHLRAINNYSLKTGDCDIQLLGPVDAPVIDNLLAECAFTFTSSVIPPPQLATYNFSGNSSPTSTAGTFIDFNGVTRNIERYTFGTDYTFVAISGSVNVSGSFYTLTQLQASSSYPNFQTITFNKSGGPGLAGFTGQSANGQLIFYADSNSTWTYSGCFVSGSAKETYDPLNYLTRVVGGACTTSTTTTTTTAP